jgi:hypothetical protein
MIKFVSDLRQVGGLLRFLWFPPPIKLFKYCDKKGFTPFAAAMTTKNNKAAQSILNREPTAAEQVRNNMSCE